MRTRFLLRYAFRAFIWSLLVLSSWGTSALEVGISSLKTVSESALAYILASIYSAVTGASMRYALLYVAAHWGLHYTELDLHLIINTIVPTLRTILVLLMTVYLFRYSYTVELGNAYAGIALGTVAILIGIMAGNEFAYPARFIVLAILAVISAVHTYYYAVNMLGPYIDRIKRVENVLRFGRTHVPIEKLRTYVREMRRKDTNFRPRLTLSLEIHKIGRVAFAALIGSIFSIGLAMAVAYASFYISIMIYKYSLYEAISQSVEIGQPETFFIVVARLGSMLYLLALRYSGVLKE